MKRKDAWNWKWNLFSPVTRRRTRATNSIYAKLTIKSFFFLLLLWSSVNCIVFNALGSRFSVLKWFVFRSPLSFLIVGPEKRSFDMRCVVKRIKSDYRKSLITKNFLYSVHCTHPHFSSINHAHTHKNHINRPHIAFSTLPKFKKHTFLFLFSNLN